MTLSWRVQNIVVIGRVYSKLERSEFSSNFEFDRNMLSGMGAWATHNNSTMFEWPPWSIWLPLNSSNLDPRPSLLKIRFQCWKQAGHSSMSVTSSYNQVPNRFKRNKGIGGTWVWSNNTWITKYHKIYQSKWTMLRGGMGVLGVIFNKYMIYELFTENNSLLLGL